MATQQQPPEPPRSGSALLQWGPAIGGIGTLLAGLAAVAAIFLARPQGPSAPATPPPSVEASFAASPAATSGEPSSPSGSPAASGAEPSAPTFGKVIYQSKLNAVAPGLGKGTVGSCRSDITDAGYTVSVEAAGRVCLTPLKAVAGALASLADVSVEATARFTELTASPSSAYGAGDVTLACRMTGAPNSGDYYAVSVSEIGYWLVDRIDGGVQKHLDYGTDPRVAFVQGDARGLGIDCFGASGGPTTIRLWVDGSLVGQATDPVGLPAGTIAIGATNYEGPTLTVTLSDLVVATP